MGSKVHKSAVKFVDQATHGNQKSKRLEVYREWDHYHLGHISRSSTMRRYVFLPEFLVRIDAQSLGEITTKLRNLDYLHGLPVERKRRQAV